MYYKQENSEVIISHRKLLFYFKINAEFQTKLFVHNLISVKQKQS
jgi:hypothetical protein